MATEQRLIDANALIRRICAERDEVEIKTACDIGYHNGLNMGASMTINAPTIEARPVVHGRWEHKHEGIYLQVRCTTCGVPAIKVNTDEFTTDLTIKWAYCPNCGAQMDGGADNG